MANGAPRVAKWVPYICIGVPILVGVGMQALLPNTEPNFWISLAGLVVTYFATRAALRKLFDRFGLD